ncbi:hypothetical protein DFJ73DRAFT_926082 [Zopfochytrium polystomum]|nr:hypothetical protein DFJ73DRAFT_926082 [Zopfochytrium polystomum]
MQLSDPTPDAAAAAAAGPAPCRKHRTAHHDLFISYRVDSDADLAARLHAALEAAAQRLVAPAGATVFLDRLSIRDAADWETEFVGGLQRAAAVVLLLSKRSWDVMVARAVDGKSDNVLKEIQQALLLKKLIIPLCVKAEDEEEFFYIYRQDLTGLVGPNCDELKKAVQALSKIQMLPIDAQNSHLTLHRILTALHPAEISDDSLAAVPQPSLTCRADSAMMKEIMGSLAAAGHCILSGISGIGNTNQYNQVLWVDCSTVETALSSLRAVFKTKDEDQTLSTFRSQMTRSGRFLLVLDSADDAHVVNFLFAATERASFLGGDILVTTRLERIPPGAFLSALTKTAPTRSQQVVKAGFWTPDTVRDHLLARCPPLAALQQDSPTLNAFLEKIGGFPIVVEQLVAFYDSMLPAVEDLESCLGEILDQTADGARQSSLVELVRLSLKGLEATLEGRVAVLLYGCVGCLDGSNVQSALMKACVKRICAKLDVKAEDVNALMVFKLLIAGGILRQVSADGAYFVHRLHQTIITDNAPKVTSTDLSAAHSIASAAYLELMEERGGFSLNQARMASHVQFLIASAPGNVSAEMLELLLLDARLDEFYSKIKEAGDKYAATRKKAEAFFGTKECAVVGAALRGSGSILTSQGHFDAALQLFGEALNAFTKAFGTPAHPDIALTLRKMGESACSRGDYDDAVRHFDSALEMYTSLHGTRQNVGVAASLNGLGHVAHARDDHAAVTRRFQESLDIYERALGTRVHPAVADALNNLGVAAKRQGHVELALRHLGEALDILQRVFGTRTHADVATVLNNLGVAERAAGRHREALAHLRESLDINVAVYGTASHPNVAGALWSVAQTLREMGDAGGGATEAVAGGGGGGC